MIITESHFDKLLQEYKVTPGFKLPVKSPGSMEDHLKNLKAEEKFIRSQMKKGVTGLESQLKSVQKRARGIVVDISSFKDKAAKRQHLKSVPGGQTGPPPPPKKPTAKEVRNLRKKLKKGENLTPRELNILKKAASPQNVEKLTKKAIYKVRAPHVIAGVVVALAIISATYDWYESRMNKAKQQCKKSSNKDECMKMYRQLAYVARIKDLESKKRLCGKSDDLAKCQGKVNQKISKIRARIQRG